MSTTTPPEGERAKLAGEVTDGDRRFDDGPWGPMNLADKVWCIIEGIRYGKIYEAKNIAATKFLDEQIAAAVAEAESKVAALEAENRALRELLSEAVDVVEAVRDGADTFDSFTTQPWKAALQPAPKV